MADDRTPPKVLVHGNPEVAAIWGGLIAALHDRGVDEIVTLSPPGFGAPVGPAWRATRAEYVGWLRSEIQAIGRPVDIVGHDWGAGHVYGLLDVEPGLVHSYATDIAGVLHPSYVWHDMAQAWQTPDVGEQVVEAMLAGDSAGRATAYVDLGIPHDVAQAMAEAANEQMGRCILGLYRDAAQPAVAELGGRLFAASLPPGLVLAPTEDAYVPHDQSVDVAARLGARVAELAGQGHWWMLEDPAPAADVLVGFWRSL
jgi:pimeloyl-ACP methyl ester carboxylesterase